MIWLVSGTLTWFVIADYARSVVSGTVINGHSAVIRLIDVPSGHLLVNYGLCLANTNAIEHAIPPNTNSYMPGLIYVWL